MGYCLRPRPAPTVPFSPAPSHLLPDFPSAILSPSRHSLGLPAFFKLVLRGCPTHLLVAPPTQTAEVLRQKPGAQDLRLKQRNPSLPLPPQLTAAMLLQLSGVTLGQVMESACC